MHMNIHYKIRKGLRQQTWQNVFWSINKHTLEIYMTIRANKKINTRPAKKKEITRKADNLKHFPKKQ